MDVLECKSVRIPVILTNINLAAPHVSQGPIVLFYLHIGMRVLCRSKETNRLEYMTYNMEAIRSKLLSSLQEYCLYF